MAAGSISCKKFTDWLIRRQEHFDTDIIKDITPTDGWVGHVSLGGFPAGEGNTRQFDKIHRVYPDLSGAWTDVEAGNCIGTPCDPTEKKIGFGYTQESYTLQEKSYATDLFCFDLVMSADRAKEQFAALVSSLRQATNIITSDRFRNEALRTSGSKVLLAANLPQYTYVASADNMTITPTAMPTSKMTIEALQRQVQPLILNGALGADPSMPPIFEYVTDMETAWSLREGNANVQNLFRFTDFVRGGSLYKYGITDAIGNFGIRIDPFPLRFAINGADLVRVMPYTNIPASGTIGNAGIQGVVNQDYLDAEVQIDFIWNRFSMKSLVRNTMQINPMMPFASRDFGGKWQFVMDNLGADANGCVIDNKRRNKGMFIADFANATKSERPEWVVAFLTLRDRACFAVCPPCFTPADYQAQDYNSANEVCEFVVTVEIPADAGAYAIEASAITCNGENIAHPAAAGLADQAALLVWLNANLGELGVWTAGVDATHIVLTGSVCSEVEVPVTSA